RKLRPASSYWSGEWITMARNSARRSSDIDPCRKAEKIGGGGARLFENVDAGLHLQDGLLGEGLRPGHRLVDGLQHARAGVADGALELRVGLALVEAAPGDVGRPELMDGRLNALQWILGDVGLLVR